MGYWEGDETGKVFEKMIREMSDIIEDQCRMSIWRGCETETVWGEVGGEEDGRNLVHDDRGGGGREGGGSVMLGYLGI